MGGHTYNRCNTISIYVKCGYSSRNITELNVETSMHISKVSDME